MGAPPVVVADTNVLVSALGWNGPERRLYARCRSGALQLVTSRGLLAELEGALECPKLELTVAERSRFLLLQRFEGIRILNARDALAHLS